MTASWPAAGPATHSQAWVGWAGPGARHTGTTAESWTAEFWSQSVTVVGRAGRQALAGQARGRFTTVHVCMAELCSKSMTGRPGAIGSWTCRWAGLEVTFGNMFSHKPHPMVIATHGVAATATRVARMQPCAACQLLCPCGRCSRGAPPAATSCECRHPSQSEPYHHRRLTVESVAAAHLLGRLARAEAASLMSAMVGGIVGAFLCRCAAASTSQIVLGEVVGHV